MDVRSIQASKGVIKNLSWDELLTQAPHLPDGLHGIVVNDVVIEAKAITFHVTDVDDKKPYTLRQPIFEGAQDVILDLMHELKVEKLSDLQKNKIKDNTAILVWTNPNGFKRWSANPETIKRML